VDVISTDVSCYDQLLGSSCNTRNGDDDDIATLVGDGDYSTTKLSKASRLSGAGVGGLVVSGGGGGTAIGGGIAVNGGGVLGNGVGSEAGGGIIYANPFMGL